MLRPGGVVVFGTKEGAKMGSEKHFENTDNGKILQAMRDAGFCEAAIGAGRLGASSGGQAWVPVHGKKRK